MTEPETPAPDSVDAEPTPAVVAKQERQFAWMTIGFGIIVVIVAAVLSAVYGEWWILALAVGIELGSLYVPLRAFRKAKALESIAS